MAKTEQDLEQQRRKTAEEEKRNSMDTCPLCHRKRPCKCGKGGKPGGSGNDEEVERNIKKEKQITGHSKTHTGAERVAKTRDSHFLRSSVDHALRLVFFPSNTLLTKEQLDKLTTHQLYQLKTSHSAEQIKKTFDSYVQRLATTEHVPVEILRNRGYSATIENGVLNITMPNATDKDRARQETFFEQLLTQGIKLESVKNDHTEHAHSRPSPFTKAMERILKPQNVRTTEQ